jgi:hypothetical protein
VLAKALGLFVNDVDTAARKLHAQGEQLFPHNVEHPAPIFGPLHRQYLYMHAVDGQADA